MAFTVSVGGNDITSKVTIASVFIHGASRDMVSVASFECLDDGYSLSIDTKDAVVIDDGGTTYFKGEVAGTPRRKEIAPDKVHWRIKCQDYNQLLNETVIPLRIYPSGTADDDIIAQTSTAYPPGKGLFPLYRSDINTTDHVANVATLLGHWTFQAQTLAQALNIIRGRTGAKAWVDFDKKLHYGEAPGTNADGLSDAYDDVDTFRYWGLERLPDMGIINKVYIKGQGISGWREDAGSVATYGDREFPVIDRAVTALGALENRGDAILSANKAPTTTYRLKTMRSGFSIGENIELTSSVYSLTAEALPVSEIITTFLTGDQPVYEIILGDDRAGGVVSGEQQDDDDEDDAGLGDWEESNGIKRYDADLELVQEYPPTSAGLDEATGDGEAGNIIEIPAVEIGDAHTFADAVRYFGLSRWGTVLTDAITLGSNTTLETMSIDVVADSGADLKGIIAPPTGMAFVRGVNVWVEQSGAGDAYGIAGSSGRIEIWGSSIDGHSVGGAGYAGRLDGSPRGDLYFYNSYCCGSTAPFNTDAVAKVYTANVTFCNTPAYEAGERGFWCGGYKGGGPPSDSAITDKITFSTEAVAAVAGANLSAAREGAGAASSGLAGYMAGGQVAAVVDTADKLTFSTETTAAVGTADLSVARGWLAGVSGGSQRGYFCGGSTGDGAATASLVTDMLTFSTDTTAARTVANLSEARRFCYGVTEGSAKGYVLGGSDAADDVSAIADKITYAFDAAAALASADLSAARRGVGGIQRERHKAFLAGGGDPAMVATADKLTFGIDTMAAKATADLSATSYTTGGGSSGGVKGFWGGGSQVGGAGLGTIM